MKNSLANWQPPAWMGQCPEIDAMCGDCGSKMRSQSEKYTFCLPCWTTRTRTHLENSQRLLARMKRHGADWYVQKFWVYCGKLRDIRIFHKIFNHCIKAKMEDWKIELMMTAPKKKMGEIIVS